METLQRTAGNTSVQRLFAAGVSPLGGGRIQREGLELQLPELGQSLRQRSRLSLLDNQELRLAPPPAQRLGVADLPPPAQRPAYLDFTSAAGAREPGADPSPSELSGRAGPLEAEIGVEGEETEYELQLTVTLTDPEHARRFHTALGDLDLLPQLGGTVAVGLGEGHAVTAQASASLFALHLQSRGNDWLHLTGVGSIDSAGSVSGGLEAEAPIGPVNLTFTTQVTARPNSDGGMDVSFSAVAGAAVHF